MHIYLEYMRFTNGNLDPKAHFLSTLKIIGYIFNSASHVYPHLALLILRTVGLL